MRCVSFDNTSTNLVSLSDDGTAKIWAVGSTGNFKCQKTLKCDSQVKSFAFCAETNVIAAGCLDGKVLLIDSTTGQVESSVTGHRCWCNIRMFEDGCEVYGVCNVFPVLVCTPTHRPCDHRVRSVAFNNTGSMLASSSDDGTAKIWAAGLAGKFECQATLSCGAFVYSVAFSPDALLIAAGCCDGKLLLIDSAGGRVKASVTGHAAAINCVCFDPSGKTVASCSVDKSVRLWLAATGTPCSPLAPAHSSWS